MARNLDSKCKQCRRIAEKLFLKGERCDSSKCALVRRKYPPGVHGPKQRIRLSNYGLQLREKQKAKKMYGILESQFADYVKKAMVLPGDAGHNLLSLLERRLDNILYRVGLANSRSQARQFVSHGLVKVNNKKLDIPSYILKTGDIITSSSKDFLVQRFKELGAKSKKEAESIPSWISFDPKGVNATVTADPESAGLPQNIDTRLIVEYYSR